MILLFKSPHRIISYAMRRNPQEHMARENKHVRKPEKEQTTVAPKSEDFLIDLMQDRDKPVFLLILDCIQDPHNLGAILRSADGAGVDAVIAPKDKSVSLTDTVVRVSVGAAENVPFVQVTNLARTMRQLQDQGVWIVGTSDKGDRSIFETDLKGSLAIAMGAEGDGLRRLTEENCDFLVKIPMKGKVPCLNVSVATGICLFEAVRQRL